jgi:PPOX class probable F420-dependent enzyme
VSFEITPIGGYGSKAPFAIESREAAASLSALGPEYRKLLEDSKYVTLGMTDAKGRVQLTPMWFRMAPDGEHFEINTAKGRAKDGHMRRDGRVTIQVTNPENPYHWVTIYGQVADVIEESDPERGHLATESIDSLSERAIGQRPYPMRAPGEERVLFMIAPTQVTTFGAP